MMLIEPLYARMKSSKRGSLLDELLPAAIRTLGAGFVRFADCGAGVGQTSVAYSGLLEQHLEPQHRNAAAVVCFEPLPENLVQLRKAALQNSNMSVRPVAVSDFDGKARFSVPSRMSAVGNVDWTPGTSFDGYLGATAAETVEVDVVRLDADGPFDFVKLDLQGGEMAALRGLGDQLSSVKLVYAENQLLSRSETVSFLRDNGFICLFDRLQFGFQNEISWVALERFERYGLKISHFNLPAKYGIPFYCVGYFDVENSPVNSDGNLADEAIAHLVACGLNYLQTDVLAVNSRLAGQLVNFL